MNNELQLIKSDFETFVQDYVKIARSLPHARLDAERLLSLLCTNLRAESIRLLMYCVHDEFRRQVRAVLKDDLNGKMVQRVSVMERLVRFIEETDIGTALAQHYYRLIHRQPEDPAAEVNPANSVSLTPYLMVDCGIVMGYLKITDGGKKAYTCRESLSGITQTAAMIIGGITRAYEKLTRMGLDFTDSDNLQRLEQAEALADLLGRARQCCAVLGLNWEEMTHQVATDE